MAATTATPSGGPTGCIPIEIPPEAAADRVWRTLVVRTAQDWRPGQELRRKGELLRLRQYGKKCILTHKGKGIPGPYKSRTELETGVSDGPQMDSILRALGYQPNFIYEKFRSEWGDGQGHVVLDHTPIGDVAEIEGDSIWIDRTAQALGVATTDYITKSYIELFFEWKRKTNRKAENMTFREIGDAAADPQN